MSTTQVRATIDKVLAQTGSSPRNPQLVSYLLELPTKIHLMIAEYALFDKGGVTYYDEYEQAFKIKDPAKPVNRHPFIYSMKDVWTTPWNKFGTASLEALGQTSRPLHELYYQRILPFY